MVGTQDPFCKVSIQGANAYKQFRTRVINNGDKGSKGSAATWNEKFSFVKLHEKTVRERILRIAVKNMNNVDATQIGQVELPLQSFMDGKLVDRWFTLLRAGGNKVAGQVHCRILMEGGSIPPQPGGYPAGMVVAGTPQGAALGQVGRQMLVAAVAMPTPAPAAAVAAPPPPRPPAPPASHMYPSIGGPAAHTAHAVAPPVYHPSQAATTPVTSGAGLASYPAQTRAPVAAAYPPQRPPVVAHATVHAAPAYAAAYPQPMAAQPMVHATAYAQPMMQPMVHATTYPSAGYGMQTGTGGYVTAAATPMVYPGARAYY